jgi:hypothetical protein
MAALAQLVSVAAPLLRDVDAALATLGAPPTHPVWRALGSVGVMPGEMVGFVADLEPARLREAGEALRAQAAAYEQAEVPTDADWESNTARYFAESSAAIRAHLAGEPASLAGRLRALASYVDSLAEWQQALRDELARVLARAMTSSQAATVRLHMSRAADTAGLAPAVGAAADIAVVLLGVAEDAAAAARVLVRSATGLDEQPYRRPAHEGPLSPSSTIRVT